MIYILKCIIFVLLQRILVSRASDYFRIFLWIGCLLEVISLSLSIYIYIYGKSTDFHTKKVFASAQK